MQVFPCKAQESLYIGDVKLTVIQVRGERVRLRVEAPQDVAVYRGEVIEHLHEAARDALSSIVPPAE
jgi:carbon storage regulator